LLGSIADFGRLCPWSDSILRRNEEKPIKAGLLVSQE